MKKFLCLISLLVLAGVSYASYDFAFHYNGDFFDARIDSILPMRMELPTALSKMEMPTNRFNPVYGYVMEYRTKFFSANPKDDDTRYNLVKALQMLEQQQQQQQQNQDQKQDQKQDQQQQQQDQQEQEQQQGQQPQEPQPEPQNEDQMDKETAEQILQALEQDEQDTQEKLQRQQGKKRRVEKEW